MSAGPPAPLAVARGIALALLGGVALYAIVAALALRETVEPLEPGVARTLTLVWYGWAAAAIAGWWLLRGRVVAGASAAARAREAGGGPQQRALPLLIAGWALLEGAALFGITLYLLGGGTVGLAGGLAIMALGIAASWPRPEWFQDRPGPA